jgi:hypothetical protein
MLLYDRNVIVDSVNCSHKFENRTVEEATCVDGPAL